MRVNKSYKKFFLPVNLVALYGSEFVDGAEHSVMLVRHSCDFDPFINHKAGNSNFAK